MILREEGDSIGVKLLALHAAKSSYIPEVYMVPLKSSGVSLVHWLVWQTNP